MKKTLLGLSAAALLLSFASCKKDYTCTCKYQIPVINKDTAFAYTIADSKRQEAHDNCDARETELRKIVSSASCEVGD